jgi:branched-chain amino acid transport system substrate-binding protein
MKRRILAIAAGAAIVASIAVTAAAGAHQADPGVTSTTIKIGGTFPLTGPASLYKVIPAAEKAYFDYINDHGGVNGRKIDFSILDDGYDPSKTVPLTQQLVEQDKVFAVYSSLGTAPNLATWDYLNQKNVPDVLLATGDSYWGFCARKACGPGATKHPWTVGFQTDYPGESKIYGKYISASLPNAKIGVLYQNDAFGKNYLTGLRVGLGAKKSQIVSAQSYDSGAASVAQQILAIKAAGADTFVIFATPGTAITALATAPKVGWSPTDTFVTNVSASSTFLKLAAANGGKVDGAISVSYLLDATVVATANEPGVALGKQILAQYAPSLDPNNGLTFYGLANAWTMVYALKNAGKTPTRAGLMLALKSLDPKKAKNPFLFPGVSLKTSPTDNFPLEQETLIRWGGGATGAWVPFGKVYDNVR